MKVDVEVEVERSSRGRPEGEGTKKKRETRGRPLPFLNQTWPSTRLKMAKTLSNQTQPNDPRTGAKGQ